MTHTGTFTIGELAVRAGVTPDALRYYEKLGLLARAPRTAGGFRVYTADALGRLRFIKQAQRQGLTLAEIRQLFLVDRRGGRDQCRDVRALLEHKLADLDARLRELRQFRRTLSTYLKRCDRTLAETPDATCPVVEDLRSVSK
jgi:DNA-binding transcriptional MerR regulator